jgi:hypothetical protein
MDFVATVLGLQLPTLKARARLQRAHKCGLLLDKNDPKIVWGCDGDFLWDLSTSEGKSLDSDDETASTLSDSDNSFSSAESLGSCVTFATPLVTNVFIRPKTDRHEKQMLYYSDSDYRQFRMDFRNSLRRRTPSVRFAAGLVTEVHELPLVENKQDVYYSSTELKQ